MDSEAIEKAELATDVRDLQGILGEIVDLLDGYLTYILKEIERISDAG